MEETSPYKKVKTTNRQWIGYINISKLNKNIPYKIIGISETNHATYGKGQQATLEAPDEQKWRTQLPGKYLASLSSNDLDAIKKDIDRGHNPYLVYRETMADKSYRIDILEKSKANDDLFSKNQIVPELDNSIEEPDPTKSDESSTDNNGSGASGKVLTSDKAVATEQTPANGESN